MASQALSWRGYKMDVIKQALDKAVEEGKLDKKEVPKKYQGEPSTPSPKPKPDDVEIPLKDVPAVSDLRVAFLEEAVLNLMMEGL